MSTIWFQCTDCVFGSNSLTQAQKHITDQITKGEEHEVVTQVDNYDGTDDE